MTNPPVLPPEVEKEFDKKVLGFLEYTSQGYSGGYNAPRCYECDQKYCGTAEFHQLCPRCKAEQFRPFFAKVIAEEKEKAKRENKSTLYALALMWNQYCGKDGHKFMSAGEEASDVLMKAGLLDDEYSEIDSDKTDNILN